MKKRVVKKITVTVERIRESFIRDRKYIHMGEGTKIPWDCTIAAHRYAPIYIGKCVMIGPYTIVTSISHRYAELDKPMINQGNNYMEIHIGDDVWIGANCSILMGSNIPDGCIIGANSLVNRHSQLEAYGIYAGTPVIKIGSRLSKNET